VFVALDGLLTLNLLGDPRPVTNPTTLRRFTSFDWAPQLGFSEVWLNPAHVAYVQPRIITRRTDQYVAEGTLIYFQHEAGVLAVHESVGQVVATLNSRGSICKDCYQELPEAWMSLCQACREHRHNGVDEDYEGAVA
jgi:hypothetical protein